jgi:hypothetical protein
MSFEFERIENGVTKDKFDDTRMRSLFIEFARKYLGLEFKSGTILGIDLINIDDESWGAEGEDAQWNGDRWVSGQRDRFGLGIDTLNMPHRKWFYFGLQDKSEKNKEKNNKTHFGYLKNLYFRYNKELDQLCIVDASIIRDLEKIKFVNDFKVNNSPVPEDWIAIPKKYVRTFNKQLDETWLENGPYCGDIQRMNRLKEIQLKNKNKNK